MGTQIARLECKADGGASLTGEFAHCGADLPRRKVAFREAREAREQGVEWGIDIKLAYLPLKVTAHVVRYVAEHVQYVVTGGVAAGRATCEGDMM